MPNVTITGMTTAAHRGADRAATRSMLERRVTDKRARVALHTRLDQLEHDLEQLRRTVRLVEHAVVWLSPQDRAAARRRLRRLGHDEQLDALTNLYDVIDGEAAA